MIWITNLIWLSIFIFVLFRNKELYMQCLEMQRDISYVCMFRYKGYKDWDEFLNLKCVVRVMLDTLDQRIIVFEMDNGGYIRVQHETLAEAQKALNTIGKY